ncbi:MULTISPECIES: hypothetical protein [Bradyrhizobium]|uniref:hypothetical protein n=1 Tax=Bradyrhizobium TaxID=374 RepID=UPI000423B3D3|nr:MULTISPECIES: hypothetical protein [Bradyrhizobium]UFW46283.1 hypothetical protein BaraCB756_28690 [Bradyrhizobium arachidis]
MAKRAKPKFLVMTVRSDDRGEDIWHIIDGRRVTPTGYAVEEHVAAGRAFRKYQVDKEETTKPARRGKVALRRRFARRTARGQG